MSGENVIHGEVACGADEIVGHDTGSSVMGPGMQYVDIGEGAPVSQVIRGGWQLAGGHGSIPQSQAIDDLVACADAGITTFDCADIYTGVEAVLGEFRSVCAQRCGQAAFESVRVHTKFVPDLSSLATITRPNVERIIDRSLTRLRMERLDLVQFHWWDYAQPRLFEVASWLTDMRQAGKIRNIGATNFDTAHMNALVDAGVPLVSMQVQYSLLDARPAKQMVADALQRGIVLLAYGTVAGGFLADRWLGEPEPREPLENRSLTKYRLVIEEFGGWDRFQSLLRVLRKVADRHGSDIATVASRAVLDRSGVAGVIVGARNRAHVEANIRIVELRLSEEDRAEIDAVIGDAALLTGDVFELERDRTSAHGSIMKYELNKEKT